MALYPFLPVIAELTHQADQCRYQAEQTIRSNAAL